MLFFEIVLWSTNILFSDLVLFLIILVGSKNHLKGFFATIQFLFPEKTYTVS